MFLDYQPKKCEVRTNLRQAPYVERVRNQVSRSPVPNTRPKRQDYEVYGPVRNVIPIRTASGYLLSPGVQNMPTVAPAKAVVDKRSAIQAAVQRNFAEWMDGVGISSDGTVIISHPAYKRIVSLGQDAIPFILKNIQQKPSLLAWALFDITKENPVRPSDYGKLDKITKAWVKWGKKNKYI
jgi:hypothetical protein